MLARGVWRSSQLISWKSAGAASARGVLLSFEVLYRPAAASAALLLLLFLLFGSLAVFLSFFLFHRFSKVALSPYGAHTIALLHMQHVSFWVYITCILLLSTFVYIYIYIYIPVSILAQVAEVRN